MEYESIQIRKIDVPKLENLESGDCCRTYIYRFANVLPEQSYLEDIAKDLQHEFKLSKETYDLPADLIVRIFVVIHRLEANKAKVMVLTSQPEEGCAYIFGIRTLPYKIEKKLGTIESIQGQKRDIWMP
jgi:hypothetical protein